MGTNKPNAEQAAFAVNAMNSGLSKRELIAAMAMQGLLADSKMGGTPNIFAELAVKYADALLEALNK